MILIITMAGNQLLSQESYRLPSYLLPWGERTVLATVVGELMKGGAISDVVLVAAQRDEPHAPHLRAIMRGLGIDKQNLFMVPPTSGQAATGAIGLDLFAQKHGMPSAPILFHNVDTIVRKRDGREIEAALGKASGYIDVFRANHHKYSYVLVDAEHRVSEIAEKIVISDTATSGLYGFENASVFREHYVSEIDRHISAVYKRMIAAGLEVVAGSVHSEADTVVVGTPDDYINASILIQ